MNFRTRSTTDQFRRSVAQPIALLFLAALAWLVAGLVGASGDQPVAIKSAAAAYTGSKPVIKSNPVLYNANDLMDVENGPYTDQAHQVWTAGWPGNVQLSWGDGLPSRTDYRQDRDWQNQIDAVNHDWRPGKGKILFIDFEHEMNGDWFRYGKTDPRNACYKVWASGDPRAACQQPVAQFKSDFHVFVTALRRQLKPAVLANVMFEEHYNFGSTKPKGAKDVNPNQWLSSDAQVIGVSFYQFDMYCAGLSRKPTWKQFVNATCNGAPLGPQAYLTWAIRHHRKLVIPEWGVLTKDWATGMKSFIKAHRGQVIGDSYLYDASCNWADYNIG